MSEANKTIARRLVEEAFNEGNYGVIEELVAPTIVNHDPATGDETGVDGVRQNIDRYRSAFPDVKITIEGPGRGRRPRREPLDGDGNAQG